MIPETTEVSVDGDVVEWRNEEFMISMDEAEAIAEEVRQQMDDPSVEGVLVDNRDADGAWPAEVNELWSELMGEMYGAGLACATVSSSATNAMQINQLSESEGTDDRIQAFTDYEDALEFLDADD